MRRLETERTQLAAVVGKPPFGATRELERTVNADTMIELDTNRYSVPWPRFTSTLPDTHAQLIAEHAQCESRHKRRLEKAYLAMATPPTVREPQDPSVIRPLTEYDAYVANQVWAPAEATS